MKLARSQLLNAAVVIASLASVLAVWLTRSAPTTGELSARAPHVLPVWRPEQVTRLQLSGKGAPIVLEREPLVDGGTADFLLTAPVRETADAAAVEKLLSALGNARVLRRVEPTARKSELGLEPPARVIDVRLDRREYHLALGAAAPTPAGARYLELSPDQGGGPDSVALLLIDAAAAEELAALDLDALRSRSLSTVDPSDVSRIELASPTLSAVLTREPGERFFLEGEPKRRVDRGFVDSLFFQLSRLTAEPFLTLAEAEPALGAERARIVLVHESPHGTLALELGGPCPQNPTRLTIVRREPEPRAACVSPELKASLGLTRDALIDRHPFTLHSDEVEELELSAQDHKLSLVRRGTAFLLRGKNDSEVELAIGNRRIVELVEIQAELGTPEPLAKLGLEPARGRATLRSSAANPKSVIEESVRLGAADEHGRVPLYREADGALLWLSAEQARSFRPDETLLRRRKLLEFGISSLTSLEVVGRERSERMSRDHAGNLQLDLPKGFQLDGGLATDLMQGLGSLETERFVADANDGSFGLENPVLSAHFAVSADDAGVKNHTLRVGAKTNGGAYAALDDDAAVFVLPRDLLDSLETSLVDRSALCSDAKSLQSISLRDAERELTLTRHGASFTASLPNVTAEQIADLEELLGSLRAEAALHTGPARPNEGFDKPSLTLVLKPSRPTDKTRTIRIGSGDSWRSMSVFYARADGVDMTFLLAQSKVRALRELL